MKKAFIMAAVAIALAAYTPEAQAQGFLKGLADKAKDKVKAQVEQKVADALGVKTKDNKAAQTTQAAQPVVNGAEEDGLTDQDLIEPIEFYYFSTVDPIGSEDSAPKFVTLSEMVKKAPGFFNPADITAEGGMEKYEAAKTEAMQLLGGVLNYGHDMAIKFTQAWQAEAAQVKPSAPASQLMKDFSAELFAYVQSKGINMENIDEAKMEAVALEFMANKLGVPAAEFKKAQEMGPVKGQQYLAQKYPAAAKKAEELGLAAATVTEEVDRKGRYMELREELHAIEGADSGDLDGQMGKLAAMADRLADESIDVMQRLAEYSETKMTEDEKVLRALYNEIAQSWPTSDACKKRDEMSIALNERLNKWLDENKDKTYDQFPAWYAEGVKAENNVVREWNTQQMTRWNEQLKKCNRHENIVMQLVALDAKVEAAKGELTNVEYLKLKSHIYGAFPEFMKYLSLPFSITDCPQHEYVYESQVM